ncbi:hypothetical protein [Streptomyces justiciae]|uniref:hypothetical protein n=1 Tax=Streptomyces justiciae TaxID=2780140 RepID=UPI0021186F7F|nr:hypothetical protein [Streptomyces justiciae]MCW8382422.1 hypothetical protein [Streptomyces justiciae]
MPPTDRSARLAAAVLGTGFAVYLGYTQPALIPALTLGAAVWMALCAFLKI